MKQIVSTKKAPAAIGPYSQAVIVNGIIYTSGVIPVNPETGQTVEGGIEEQTRQVLMNLSKLLEASGAGMKDIVKTTVFIKNMDDFSKINDVYASFFSGDFPARSCIEAARLPKDVWIEIEAIAVKA
ncbi:MAG: RidA family protein [Lachnoclostridium sp.]|nr:RidA family protein [Lachnoclostridium sp.]